MTGILVVATILLFLGIDWIVQARERKAAALAPGQARATDGGLRVRVPEGVFFAPSHTWLNLFPSGKVLLGVDDFVTRLLKSPRITLLKNAGDRVAKGDAILRLESNGHSLMVRSPIAGEILAPNADLARRPQLMDEALFRDGWAYAIRPGQPAEMKTLFLGDESRRWIQTEFGRLRDFFAGTGSLAPAVLQDGGPPAAGVMNSLDEKVWQEFEDEFLQVR